MCFCAALHFCVFRTCREVLPAEASDQHAHNDGAQQTSNSEDGHSERVHEGQGLPTESCSITTHNRLIVEVFYILRQGGRRRTGWKDVRRGEEEDSRNRM